MDAIIITIGDEILNGDIIDTNTSWIGKQLEQLGLKIIERLTLPDSHNAILNGFKYAHNKADFVIITGGLGPTQDDLTKECFATFFNQQQVEYKPLRQQVENLYRKRGRDINDVTPKMYCLPKNCIMFMNDYGVAPAMWQQKENTTFVALPGVPFEMKGLMTDHILPKIQQDFKLPFIQYHYFNTIGKGEPVVEKLLTPIVRQLPNNLSIAYLPSFGKVTVRLFGRGEKSLLNEQFNTFVPLIRERLTDVIFSELRNDTIANALVRLCKKRKISISTAESCTGGNIASEIVGITGASTIFNGSIVAYQNDIKTNILGVSEEVLSKFGAVSEPVVEQMATSILNKMKTNYSIAISGIAGPTGGTETKPVGTVCIAVANSSKKRSKTLNFVHNRTKNIQLFTTYALDMLYRFILEDNK